VATTCGEVLLAQTEPLDQRTVLVGVRALEVIEQLSALADQHEQPAPGVVILDVGFEMSAKTIDALGDERDLDFG